MENKNLNIDIPEPQKQLNLYGFDRYFKMFIDLFNKKKLPNSILLSGPKGLGKATFAYHLINYFLSKNEEYSYDNNNYAINEKNLTFKNINNSTHHNFFLINSQNSGDEIKVEKIRKLLIFLNKTTYSQNIKFVIIDDAEKLNINSSNALLKAIEEPNPNTFFFIIHNSSTKIIDTIKSRCVQFNIFFNEADKTNIFNKLANKYNLVLSKNKFIKNLFFDTPGNILKYSLFFYNVEENSIENNFINYVKLIDIFKKNKNPEILLYISLSIEIFYNEIVKYKNNNINLSFHNYNKILNQLNDMKKFYLDDKAILFWIKDILKSETK